MTDIDNDFSDALGRYLAESERALSRYIAQLWESDERTAMALAELVRKDYSDAYDALG